MSVDSDELLNQLKSHLDEMSTTLSPCISLAQLVQNGLLNLPLPGAGRTRNRLDCLREFGRHDLSLARLAEGHADALAILAESGVLAPPGGVLGVWGAGPVGDLTLRPDGDGWLLEGRRRWCSGASSLSHALVRAKADNGERLVLVAIGGDGVQVVPDSWVAVGMAQSFSMDVDFHAIRIQARDMIGEPGFYLARRGFWAGAIGVAAVWLGAAESVAQMLVDRAKDDPHRLAHLGAVCSRLYALGVLLEHAALVIDDSHVDSSGIQYLAGVVRAEVEAGCSEILERTGRATGADPLAHDQMHARRVADLTVYLRQSHAESDLAELGRLRLAGGRESRLNS